MTHITNPQCWLILLGAVAASGSCLLLMLSPAYRDTLLERMALAAVALSGYLVTLQILVHGFAHGSGVAWLSLSCGGLAVVLAVKHRPAGGYTRSIMIREACQNEDHIRWSRRA